MYRCTKRNSKGCKASIKVENTTGKIIWQNLDHSHPGEIEPHLTIKNIGDIDMEGAAGDQAIE